MRILQRFKYPISYIGVCYNQTTPPLYPPAPHTTLPASHSTTHTPPYLSHTFPSPLLVFPGIQGTPPPSRCRPAPLPHGLHQSVHIFLSHTRFFFFYFTRYLFFYFFQCRDAFIPLHPACLGNLVCIAPNLRPLVQSCSAQHPGFGSFVHNSLFKVNFGLP